MYFSPVYSTLVPIKWKPTPRKAVHSFWQRDLEGVNTVTEQSLPASPKAHGFQSRDFPGVFRSKRTSKQPTLPEDGGPGKRPDAPQVPSPLRTPDPTLRLAPQPWPRSPGPLAPPSFSALTILSEGRTSLARKHISVPEGNAHFGFKTIKTKKKN